MTLELISRDPSIDFAKCKLSPEINDDWIIASILEWSESHPGADVRLVSADLGIFIKAQAHSIQVVTPVDADRLPDELDADEKRTRQLQKELEELKNVRPQFEIAFADGEKVMRFKLALRLPTDASSIATEMKAIHSKYPLLQLPQEPKGPAKEIRTLGELEGFVRKPGPTVVNQRSREEAIHYNSTLERFHKDYAGYLNALHVFRNAQLRTIRFALSLNNDGTSPAEDVDIDFHFPDGFDLFDADKDELPKLPEPPSPPKRMGTFGFNNLRWNSETLLPTLSAITKPPLWNQWNVSSPSIKRTNSYDVRSEVKRAKHGCTYTPATFVVVFDCIRC